MTPPDSNGANEGGAGSSDADLASVDPNGSEDAAPASAPKRIEAAEAARVLFPDEREATRVLATCPGDDAVPCLLRARYAGDRDAAATAIDLFAKTGSVAGLLPRQEMDGGYRGLLQLAPVLPIGPLRAHLAWVHDAFVEHDRFLAAIAAHADDPIAYRWRDVRLRFFASERVHTPAAFAEGDTVAYNVRGSLNVSGPAVTETLFHELFHLNDQEHGDWSPRALGETYDAIVARCGTKPACLRPFAPNDTMVRNGTYYAFQPGNGVREYAAELAVRYFREERAAMRGENHRAAPFKCGPKENQLAWRRFVDAFFGGVDLVAECG